MTAFRRTASPLVLATVAAAALAGCGSSSDSGGSAAVGAPAASSTAPSGGVATAEPNASSSPSKVDAAFLRQMLPHHQLAVEMAKLAPGKTDHVEITVFAKSIIRKQTAEIAALRSASKRLGVTASTAMTGMAASKADSQALGLSSAMMGMSMNTASLNQAKPFDKAFLNQMLPHHRGAILMAKSEVIHGGDKAVQKIARTIIIGQSAEVAEMSRWNREWYPSK